MNYYLNQEYKGNHRGFVGGMWEKIGRLQFDFLVGDGLKKSEYVLDFGCGSLRLGVHLIPWLYKGRYHGVEQIYRLIIDGIEHELTQSVADKKDISVSNDLYSISRSQFDVIIAQSVFTHHTRDSIKEIFPQLVKRLRGRMYVTYFEGDSEGDPTKQPFEWWEELGEEYQLNCELCPYDHPRGQKMLKFL